VARAVCKALPEYRKDQAGESGGLNGERHFNVGLTPSWFGISR
jgi:hypothetical protein